MIHRQPTSQAIRHGALALWLLLVLPFSALAGTAEGVSWLTTQQTANGSPVGWAERFLRSPTSVLRKQMRSGFSAHH